MATSYSMLTEWKVLLKVLHWQRLSNLKVFTMAKTVGVNNIIVDMGVRVVFYVWI